jgi:hypothetical protein
VVIVLIFIIGIEKYLLCKVSLSEVHIMKKLINQGYFIIYIWELIIF